MLESGESEEVVVVDGIEERRVRGSLWDEVRDEVPDVVFRRCIREDTESIELWEFSRVPETDELRLEDL
jgi:hypothetical protein